MDLSLTLMKKSSIVQSDQQMDMLQGTKLDWYVKDMPLKRHLPQLPEWKQSVCF
jgi:hypothetical protein